MNWVGPRWVDTLSDAGRRVIAFDNRGHGQSEKLYAPADYHLDLMTRDAANLLAHLSVERADVMGYSMGARIASFLAVAEPRLVRALVLGGLGDRLVRDGGLPEAIAEALEAPSLDSLTDPTQRLFRGFAEQTQSDRAALAACVRGSRRSLTLEEAARTLGAPPWRTFLRITLPLSAPGIMIGCLVTFVQGISSFVTPKLLGGGRIYVMATTIYEETFETLNWPLAAAMSIVLVAVFGLCVAIYERAGRRFAT